MDRKVVIVGAGIGGIVTAARLARDGFQVRVIEKEDRPGGRCNIHVRDGHRFDTGPTFVIMPDLYVKGFEFLNEDIKDHLDLVRVDPTYELHFHDGTTLTLTSDLGRMEEQLESMEKGSFKKYLTYLKEGELNYRLSLKHFMERQFNSIFAYLNPINIWLLFRLKILINHYRHVSGFFKDQRLREAFTFQDTYLGLSPFESPSIFSLIQYSEFEHGVWFPKGGIYEVIKALTRIAERNGAIFEYGREVARIDLVGNRATGVTLSSGERLEADIVVGNADLPYIYGKLLPDDGSYSKLSRKKYSFSALMYLWGLDKEYPQFRVHNLYLGSDYRGGFRDVVDNHSMAKEPNFYIHAPKRIDGSMAPEGQDTIVAIIPVGHIDGRGHQDWKAMKERGRRLILDRLKEDGIKDLEAHIKFEVSVTPPDWEKRYNLTYGSILSLRHNFMQLGYLRPHNRHRKFHNLYFVGGSTHPGAGLPTIMISSRLVCNRIKHDLLVDRS